MAATPGRTTIKAAVDEFVDKLRTNLTADPPTTTKPFWRVSVGQGGESDFARPFLSFRLTSAKAVGVIDGDKIMECSATLKVVTDVIADDPFGAMLDKIGALEDYLDSIVDTGVIDGADGFDRRVWTFDQPRATSGARLASASATQTFVVKVQRNQNRVPAA